MAEWRSDERVKLLQELTQINSGSRNIAGVDAVQDVVARELRKLGLDVAFEMHPQGSSAAGKFVIAGTPGPSGPLVDLVTHADTVFEPGSGLGRFALDEKSGTAHGPGVLDDKGGIIVALEGLKRFFSRSPTRKIRVRFLCTPTEELGSPGFEPLFKKLSGDSTIVLGFEPSLEDGSIIQSRRGNRWYQIRVEGQEGHAGRDHARGINAAHELACKLVELHKLSKPKKDLTISTGQISGGSTFNVVCGHAEAKVDVRFADFKTRDRVHREIESIVNAAHIRKNSEGKLPSASYELADDCPPFASTKKSQPFIAKYLDLIHEIEGASVQAAKSGGSADSNYMSREGLVILDGLGASGGKIHSDQEFIRLSSLETRAECLARFLCYINESR